MEKTKTIYGLNWIRSIATILIMLYHYTYRFTEHEIFAFRGLNWEVQISFGCNAVVTFFVLSGLLSDHEFDLKNNVRNYVIKKFIRLYPMFWIAMIITIMVEVLLFPSVDFSIVDVIKNVTMIPGILGARPVDGAYWTLQYEIIYCIIVAFVIEISHKAKKDLSGIAFLGLSSVSILVFFLPTNRIVSIITIISLAEWSGCFLSGLTLKRVADNSKDYIAWATLLLAIISSYLWLGKTRFYWLLGSVAVCVYVLIRKSSIINNVNTKGQKLITGFASISYLVYLLHQYVGYSIIYCIIEKTGVKSEFIILIPTIIVLIVASLLHVYIEKPIIKLRLLPYPANFSRKS